jgi:hypothetical protein
MLNYILQGIKGLHNRIFEYNFELEEDEPENLSYWRKEDMLHMIDENTPPDEFEIINPEKDIIISVPTNNNFIQSRPDGTFNITTDRDYALTQCRVFGNSVAFNFNPKMKMSTPKGIKVVFDTPIDNQICDKMYLDFDVSYKDQERFIVAKSTIYNRLNFTVLLDNNRILALKKTFSLLLGTPLVNFYFTYLFIGEQIASYNKIYLIKNTDVFEKFDQYYQ